MRRPISAPLLLVLLAMMTSSCGDRSGRTLDDPVFDPPELPVVVSTLPPEPTTATLPLPLTLTASWVDGATVPGRQTCLGEGLSPALTWANVPLGTSELAISVVDIDAGNVVHWLAYAISTFETGVIEGQLPQNAFEWANDFGNRGFDALCPPSGETHRYLFTLYALNQQLEVAEDASAAEALSELEITSIARASVSGLVTSDT